ncbi:25356_t:CDS:2, partial [Gigaspora rosea]
GFSGSKWKDCSVEAKIRDLETELLKAQSKENDMIVTTLRLSRSHRPHPYPNFN